MKSENLKNNFFKYIIPSIASQWIFALYTMVDGLFIAKGVSENGLGAVNVAMPFMTILFSCALTFSIGSSTLISICFGTGNKERAHVIYSQLLLICLVFSVFFSAAAFFYNRPIAHLLGAHTNTIDYASQYIKTIGCYSASFIFGYMFEVMIKTDGHPVKSTLIVTNGVVLNCLLDYVFVIVLKKGVFGAATATGISQTFVLLLFLIHFFSKKSSLKLRPFRFSLKLFFNTFGLGISSGITELSVGIVIYLFNHFIILKSGEDFLVSYTVISYINTIIVMSMNGLIQGLLPLLCYYYGKKQINICRMLLYYAMVFCSVFSILVFAATQFLNKTWINLFISNDHPNLRMYTYSALRIFSLSFIISGFNIIIGGYFTAMEKPGSSLIISLSRSLVFVALGLIILTNLLGEAGIWWTPVFSESITFIITMLLYCIENKKGKKSKI